MRIERIDIQGFGPLTGTFGFPEHGLGVWGAPNQSGKTTLTHAVATALYGEVGPPSVKDGATPPWITRTRSSG